MQLTSTQRIFIQLCQQTGLPAPQPEYRFNPKRKFMIDYYFEKDGKKLALEVEGGIWIKGGGRHNRAASFLKDIEKYNNLSLNGIYLLRVTPDNLLKISTIEMVKSIIFAPQP